MRARSKALIVVLCLALLMAVAPVTVQAGGVPVGGQKWGAVRR